MVFLTPIYIPPHHINIDNEEEEKEVITNPMNTHPLAEQIALPDGSFAMDCVDCLQRFQWAEPNQDNGTFRCYSCRTGI